MVSVWAIIHGVEYDGENTHALFSTKALAREHIEHMRSTPQFSDYEFDARLGHWKGRWGYIRLEEMGVDECKPPDCKPPGQAE